MINGGPGGINPVDQASLFKLPALELTSTESIIEQAIPTDLPKLELTGNAVHSQISAGATEPAPAAVSIPEDVELAESLYEMAGLQAKAGNHKKAQRLLSHALMIVEEKLGSEHIAAAQILTNLGTVHLLQGNYEYAERFLHRAILILDVHNGTEVEIAHAFNNLSAVYNRLGEYSDGERCLQEALAIMEKVLLEQLGHTNHPELIPILENYAELMQKTNRSQHATQLKARIETIKLHQSITEAA